MSSPFPHFDAAIDAAADDDARRALLFEVSQWRATRLTDVPSQRDAAWALARLHHALGERVNAEREARSLGSLCRTAPEAARVQEKAARDLLDLIRGRKPKADRPERPAREARSDRSDRSDRDDGGAVAAAAAAAAQGDWAAAGRLLQGRRGARAELLRVFVALGRAEANGDASALADAASREIARLRSRLLPESGPPAAEAAPKRAPVSDDPRLIAARDALAEMLGEEVRDRFRARAAQLERAAAERTGDALDALAAAALRHHVLADGHRKPAPWLVGLVAGAMASGSAKKTRAVLVELRAQGAWAVTAYDELPFVRLVSLWRAALEAGWDALGMHRGVHRKLEPADRTIWTLRLSRGFEPVLVACAPPSDASWPGDAAALVDRLVGLEARVVLVAPSDGNAPLRDAAAARGVAVADGDDAAVLAAAAGAEPAASSAPAAPVASGPAATAPAPAPEPEPQRPSPFARIRALLADEARPEVSALVSVLEEVRKLGAAMPAVRHALDDVELAERDPRLAALLTALDQVAPPDLRLSSATTLAVAVAADAPGGEVERLLDDGPTGWRYGGPGIADLLSCARAASSAGWSLGRVFRGVTGKERREQPALDTLDPGLQGLWRVELGKDGVEGELWFVAELPVEGRAALPQLLVSQGQRVVVLPLEPQLISWYNDLGAGPAVAWTGAAEDVVEALDGLGRSA